LAGTSGVWEVKGLATGIGSYITLELVGPNKIVQEIENSKTNILSFMR